MNSTKPTQSRNDVYLNVIDLPEMRVTIDQNLIRQPVSCPFQQPCWKTIRAPIARKGYRDENGVFHKIYMPYICSFQLEGDLSNCGHHAKFMEERDRERERDKIDDGNLPA